jgi:hypothetical protein
MDRFVLPHQSIAGHFRSRACLANHNRVGRNRWRTNPLEHQDHERQQRMSYPTIVPVSQEKEKFVSVS